MNSKSSSQKRKRPWNKINYNFKKFKKKYIQLTWIWSDSQPKNKFKFKHFKRISAASVQGLKKSSKRKNKLKKLTNFNLAS